MLPLPSPHGERLQTPQTLLLLLKRFPPTADNPPRATPVRVVPTGCSPWWNPLAWMPPTRLSPSGTDQCGSTMRSQVLLANLLHQARGLAPVQASHSISCLQAFPCLGNGSSRGCKWISAPGWDSMGCRGGAVSPWTILQAAGQSQLWHLEHPLPFLLHWPQCL